MEIQADLKESKAFIAREKFSLTGEIAAATMRKKATDADFSAKTSALTRYIAFSKRLNCGKKAAFAVAESAIMQLYGHKNVDNVVGEVSHETISVKELSTMPDGNQAKAIKTGKLSKKAKIL